MKQLIFLIVVAPMRNTLRFLLFIPFFSILEILPNWNKIFFLARRGNYGGQKERGTSLPRPRYFLVRATSNASTHDTCTRGGPTLGDSYLRLVWWFSFVLAPGIDQLPAVFYSPSHARITQPSFFFLYLLFLHLSLFLSFFLLSVDCRLEDSFPKYEKWV